MNRPIFNRAPRWSKQDVLDLMALTTDSAETGPNVIQCTQATCQLRGLLSRPEGDIERRP